MKRWLKWIGIGLAMLIVAIALFALWLLEAESGARFALERAKAALADKLIVENSAVRWSVRSSSKAFGIATPMRHRRQASKSVRVDYEFFGLFSRACTCSDAQVEGVDVVLTSVPRATPAVPPPSLQTLLTPPLAILIDRAHVAQ